MVETSPSLQGREGSRSRPDLHTKLWSCRRLDGTLYTSEEASHGVSAVWRRSSAIVDKGGATYMTETLNPKHRHNSYVKSPECQATLTMRQIHDTIALVNLPWSEGRRQNSFLRLLTNRHKGDKKVQTLPANSIALQCLQSVHTQPLMWLPSTYPVQEWGTRYEGLWSHPCGPVLR